MPPTKAQHPGEEGIVIDMANVSGRYNAPQTVENDEDNGLLLKQQTGKAFWNAEGVTTVAMPWIPFFSNCDLFDSHIILWDLFEMPDGVRDGCEQYAVEEVQIVPPLGLDLATLSPR